MGTRSPLFTHRPRRHLLKLRPSLILLPIVSALTFGTLAPAQAADTDAVTGLAVAQAQVVAGRQITATWTDNPDATAYTVAISANADGSGTSYGAKDASSSPATITTDSLLTGEHYFVVVTSKATGSTAASLEFTADALDTAGPTGGNYKLNRTSAWMTADDAWDIDDDVAAAFTVTQVGAASDASGAVTRKISAGDGSAAKAWSTGSTFKLLYTRAGSFTPHVVLTDAFGNATDLALSPVKVLKDGANPRVHVTTPAKASKKASWRVIRGTASDSASGVEMAMAFVCEKRGSIWYTYDFHKRKWLKGGKSLTTTIRRSTAIPAMMTVTAGGRWHTPAIKGLTRGTLHVEAAAMDAAWNIGEAPKVNRRIS